uniref:Uncharacterized protein n=1 Tax=Psilocybe cubensis TaxID=181762 RepID=A0A8H7XYJ2_PSICU
MENLPAIWVTNELKKKKALIDFLNKHGDNVPQIPNPPTNYRSDFILNSLSSRFISLARTAQQPDQIVVNVYCWPPTKQVIPNNTWLKAVRSLRFFMPYGEVVASTPLSCGWCYALDHPTGLCKYNDYGPSDDTSSSDLTSNNSITTARRRQYPAYTMREDVLATSRNARGARRGATGRGSGGRGTNGRARGRGI